MLDCHQCCESDQLPLLSRIPISHRKVSLIGKGHTLGKLLKNSRGYREEKHSGGPMFNIRRSSTKYFRTLLLFFNPLPPLFMLCPLFANNLLLPVPADAELEENHRAVKM